MFRLNRKPRRFPEDFYPSLTGHPVVKGLAVLAAVVTIVGLVLALQLATEEPPSPTNTTRSISG